MQMAKRNSWGAIRQLPNKSKRFQANYIGPDGERHNAPDTFTTRTEASQFLAEMRSEISRGVWVDPKETKESPNVPKFMAFALEHLEHQSNSRGEELRPSTKSVYLRQLNTHCKDFADLPLSEINKKRIDTLFSKLRSEGKKTTAAKIYKLLNAIFRRAVDYGYVAANPCSIKGANSLTTGKPVNIPTVAEVWAIADLLPPKLRMMVLMCAYGGFRFGEVTELRVGDLKLVEQDGTRQYIVSVSRAVTLVGRAFVVNKPKSAMSTRSVVLTQGLTGEIGDYLYKHVEAHDSALLFPRSEEVDGRDIHLRHDVMSKKFTKVLRTLGIDGQGITFHSLRHFAGTQFNKSGATYAELMAWMGDSSIASIQRYLHVTGEAGQIANRMPVPTREPSEHSK
jgi:integrase